MLPTAGTLVLIGIGTTNRSFSIMTDGTKMESGASGGFPGDPVYERLLCERIIVLSQQVDDDIANKIGRAHV